MLVDLFIMNCDFDTLCSFALLLIKWPILQLQWHIFFLYIRRRVWPMIVKFTSLYFVVVVMWQWYDAIIDHRRQSGRESQTKKMHEFICPTEEKRKKKQFNYSHLVMISPGVVYGRLWRPLMFPNIDMNPANWPEEK